MAEKSMIPLSEEINRLEYYLSLEQIRFEDKMDWSITIDPSLNPMELEIPNMIIQPFIENSIWHGIMPVPYKGYINLSIQASNNDTLAYYHYR
jgi:LytS/YehU family sensor histidine kinase